MLGISINNEFLDLAPGTALDMDMSNALLQFGEEISGEFSLPAEVKATPKNLRLLNYAAVMEKRIANSGIDAIVYDNGVPILRGKIKIEKTSVNMNKTGEGSISVYFLSGRSSFYQEIKDKRLRDIDVGGERSFVKDDYATTGPGFWAHVRAVMLAAPGYGSSGYDYAFFPVYNAGWPGRGTVDFMNLVYTDTPSTFYVRQVLGTTGDSELNRIVPFPYLKYVLLAAVAHVGWKINGDILDDAMFKKVVLIDFVAIDWGYNKKEGSRIIIQRDPVVFNLQDHLCDITISNFLIALKNRFGWHYDFDNATRTINIIPLETIATGDVKDFTTKASPLVNKTINQETKVYALRNVFSTDLAGGNPNFTVVALQGSVNLFANLPAAVESMYGYVWLVVAENNYYICQQNEATEAWEWILFAYNIYDYEPANVTDDITTGATTIGVQKYDNYHDLVPRVDHQGMWFGKPGENVDWGIILCFNHGPRNNKAGELYPYASSHVYDSNFNQVADWALTFECKLAGGVTEVGLYKLNWKKFLDMLKSPEEADVKLYLSRPEYNNLSFADKLVLRNVKFFIKNMKPTIPYNGEVNLRVVRI